MADSKLTVANRERQCRSIMVKTLALRSPRFLSASQIRHNYMSHLVGKPTMWFPNRSDTNQAVQAQKQARSLKFRI